MERFLRALFCWILTRLILYTYKLTCQDCKWTGYHVRVQYQEHGSNKTGLFENVPQTDSTCTSVMRYLQIRQITLQSSASPTHHMLSVHGAQPGLPTTEPDTSSMVDQHFDTANDLYRLMGVFGGLLVGKDPL